MIQQIDTTIAGRLRAVEVTIHQILAAAHAMLMTMPNNPRGQEIHELLSVGLALMEPSRQLQLAEMQAEMETKQ